MDALREFFYMGGYAFYVWSAYGVKGTVGEESPGSTGQGAG